MVKSRHAQTRAQQRGIPPGIAELLDRYGEERHLGDGRVVSFLSKRGRRQMEQDWGRQAVARLSPWLGTYEIRSLEGVVITVAHRTRPLRWKS